LEEGDILGGGPRTDIAKYGNHEEGKSATTHKSQYQQR